TPTQANEEVQFDFSRQQGSGGMMDDSMNYEGPQEGSDMGQGGTKEDEDQQEMIGPREKAERASEEKKTSSGGSETKAEQQAPNEELIEEEHDEAYDEYEDGKAQNSSRDQEKKDNRPGGLGIKTRGPKPESVPEPGTLLGLGVLASSLGLLKPR
ncbi:MAG: PEP-CTERM sorting domain-containing protein, partial [Cyanobacteria bacterium J06632_22]